MYSCIVLRTRGFSNFRFRLHNNLAVKCETREHALFENYKIFFFQTEEIVAAKELSCGFFSMFTCHYVPVKKKY